MSRPSKLRVLLAVNLWRILHKRTPILYLPKGERSEAQECPLKYALGVDEVSASIWYGEDGLESTPTPPILSAFRDAFDDGLYPELEAS